MRIERSTWGVLVFAVMALALALAWRPATAAACGGLFCDSAQPVNQAAERILFAENGDGTVTAVIEIQYEGPAEKFSWVLPVPGVPDVEVSSVVAFDRLQQATNPQYTLNTSVEDCGSDFGGVLDAAASAGGTGGGGGAGGDDEGPGVIVLAAGSVGPFNYEVIKVNPTLADPADVALDWLMDNGYDVSDLGPDVLRPYLADGLNLLAFRLTKTADSGSIRPISITYDSSNPFIPIRPTAVAANDDMGIMVWLVSGARAIPANYKALELNEARINWFNPMSTYNDVVSAAADESGGQGFVTEMAGASATLEGVVVQSREREQWTALQNQTFSDPLDLLQQVSDSFFGWDGVEDALRAAVTLPANLSLEDFVACPRCYVDDPGVVIDETGLLTHLYEMVVKPMFATEDLLQSRPYVTRLYTTMSADEMTMDPLFDTNLDLADVSNVHTADQYIRCDGTWEITLPQGGVVYGAESGTWPDVGDQPAAFKILQLTTMGQGKTLENNGEKIRALLEANAPAGGGGRGGSTGGGGAGAGTGAGGDADGGVFVARGSNGNRSDCGCRAAGATRATRSGAGASLALLALGALLWRRRKAGLA